MLPLMIRSLVAPPQLPVEGDDFIVRRNLSQESLVESINNRELMWLDFVDPTAEEIAWLESAIKLHPIVVSDLKREDRRPTLLVFANYLFLSLFQAQLKGFHVEAEEIHCLVGECYFVTVRKAGATTIDAAYERAAGNKDYWRRGVSYFLYLTLQFVIDSYYPLLDRISNQLNKLEEAIMMNGDKITQQSVFRIKQQLINLRQMVAPQREVLSNVIGEERLMSQGEQRQLFRHLYERLLRVYDVIDSQRDLSSNVLDLIESQSSAKLSIAVNRLTVLSMIFLPLTFLIGFFGLNFVTTAPEMVIPLSGDSVFVLLLALTAGAAALALVFRRKGWL
jgi:magnesium transporter